MDIDIDLKTDFNPHDVFDNIISASMVDNGKLKKHPVGVYFQNIPKDPITTLSAIPYQESEELGFLKIDFLHLSLLDAFNSKEEIRELLKIEPNWDLLLNENVVRKLFQIHRHFDILYHVKPKSVQELADVISLIRPAKRNLLQYYNSNKFEVRKELYKKPKDDKYYFKKSHAISYALCIVLQLNAIEKGLI